MNKVGTRTCRHQLLPLVENLLKCVARRRIGVQLYSSMSPIGLNFVAGFLVQLVEGLATLDASHVSPRECTAVQTDEREQRPMPSVGRFSSHIPGHSQKV